MSRPLDTETLLLAKVLILYAVKIGVYILTIKRFLKGCLQSEWFYSPWSIKGFRQINLKHFTALDLIFVLYIALKV